MSEPRSFSSRSSRSSHSRSHSRQRSRSRTRPALNRSGSSQGSIRRSSATSVEFNNPLKLSPYHFSQHPQFHSQEISSSSTSNNDEKSTEVPTINVVIDHTLPQEYFKTNLLNMIKALRISKWHRLPIIVASDINLKRISGALTNAIYKIDAPSVVILKNYNLHTTIFPSLLLRIYGPNADSIIDRTYELKVLTKLSKKNIGPKLLGIFKNGRLEQYLENALTLTKKDLTNLKTSARIARRMKELHVGIPLSTREKDLGPTTVRNIKLWLSNIEDWIINDNFNFKNTNEINLFKMNFNKFKKNVYKYLEWLESKYDSKTFKDLVFCHNDTQYGNLLFSTSLLTGKKSITKEEVDPLPIKDLSNLSLKTLPELNPSLQEKKQDQNLVVIDFEYSGPNFPAYDIANHFCEWMHNYNHPTNSWALDIKDFPSVEEQLNFNYSYLLFRNPEFEDINKANDENLRQLETQSKIIYNEVINWRPAVSLFWSFWAILQSGPLESAKDDSIVFENGVNGETYQIIKEDEVEEEGDGEVEIDEGVEGSADNENFEYLLYARNKLEVFYGDLVQSGIISKDDIDDSEKESLKYLSVEHFHI